MFLASPWYACNFYVILCIVEKGCPYLLSCLFSSMETLLSTRTNTRTLMYMKCCHGGFWTSLIFSFKYMKILGQNVLVSWYDNSHLKVKFDDKALWIGSNKYILRMSRFVTLPFSKKIKNKLWCLCYNVNGKARYTIHIHIIV